MPYISEEERDELDRSIAVLINNINQITNGVDNPEDFSNYLGRLNYCFSRIIMGVMKRISYKNIAMATGVLENTKQELYRRVAHIYEDSKIIENGDIPEYSKLR